MSELETHPSWHPVTRIFFRFFFVYFVLYILPLLAVYTLSDLVYGLWTPLINWVAEHILRLDYTITVLPNGSGDTTWNYVQVLTIVLLSSLVTLIWSVTDRHRKQYDAMFYWLCVGLRYVVGLTLIHYGFAKIFPTQFALLPSSLSRTYGDSSPMGLLWTFMSFSPAYNFFTGFCEALGGFLLLFRPTKLMGALMNLAVLSNIVVLNFTYDVPVKLLSSHLLIMNIFLMLPDLSRMIDFFVLNRPIFPRKSLFQLADKKLRNIYVVCKFLLIAAVLAGNLRIGQHRYRQLYPDSTQLSSFAGQYVIDYHIVNNDTLPPVANDTRRWKKLTVSWSPMLSKEVVAVRYMDDAEILFNIAADSVRRQFKILSMDSSTVYDFRYDHVGNRFAMHCLQNGDTLQIGMQKADSLNVDGPQLMARGFHWINETPYYK